MKHTLKPSADNHLYIYRDDVSLYCPFVAPFNMVNPKAGEIGQPPAFQIKTGCGTWCPKFKIVEKDKVAEAVQFCGTATGYLLTDEPTSKLSLVK